MVSFILLYRNRSWLKRTFLRNNNSNVLCMWAQPKILCTNEKRYEIPSFVGIMSYYWLELTTRADGITTVVTFWHARYLHTHHPNYTPPKCYSIRQSYIYTTRGYVCVALLIGGAPFFWTSFASYFNHYLFLLFLCKRMHHNVEEWWSR